MAGRKLVILVILHLKLTCSTSLEFRYDFLSNSNEVVVCYLGFCAKISVPNEGDPCEEGRFETISQKQTKPNKCGTCTLLIMFGLYTENGRNLFCSENPPGGN